MKGRYYEAEETFLRYIVIKKEKNFTALMRLGKIYL
jgi:hypothetical protein